MSDVQWQINDEISLLALGTTLLRNRWRIMRWMVAGGFLAGALVITKPALYKASASFVPQGVETGRSSLVGFAVQLGVTVATGDPSSSPEFYSKLLKSRVLLSPIVRDTFAVKELGGQRIAFLDLYKIPAGSTERREEQGIDALRSIVGITVVTPTGVTELTVLTPWRSFSLAVVSTLIEGINHYHQQTRQGQAAAERKFVVGRLAVATTELHASEDRLQQFLRTNRQISNSPELTFEHERLQRDMLLRQQMFTSLTQSNEEVMAREVRDTPVIRMFEAPFVPTLPEPRGRAKSVLVGLMLGAFVGALLSLISGTFSRRLGVGDAKADEFAGALREVVASIRRLGRRSRA
jgi:uncharacterized protein involved in exopolysaccharide biosynthesis